MVRFLLLFVLVIPGYGQLFQTRDFTDSVFTSGIEGPAFQTDGTLLIVNYQREGTIGMVSTTGKASLYATLPPGSVANSIRILSDGALILADYTKHNIWRLNPETRQLTSLVQSDRFNQPNDLCVSGTGLIFASDPNWKLGTGQVWGLTKKGKLKLLATMGTTNGICLSPDDKILYVNESVQRKIWAFDVSPTGKLSNKRLFFTFQDYGLDGMKCDTAGNLYVTRHGKGTILVLSSKGNIVREIPLAGKLCSNLVFGGPGLNWVYVTLQDRGRVERFQVEIPGKPY